MALTCVFLALFVLFGLPIFVWLEPWKLFRRCAPVSDEARELGRLLALDGDNWKADRFVVHNRVAGVGIWISNGDYGIKWWVGGVEDYGKANSDNYTVAEKNHVWLAYEAWRRGVAGDVLSAARTRLTMLHIEHRGVTDGTIGIRDGTR